MARKVLVWVGAVIAAALWAGSGSVSAAPAADLVVLRANVMTAEASAPRAEAFAVRDGRIIAVGSTAEIERLGGSRTRVLDLTGRTVTPGFIDTHMHPEPVFDEMSRFGRLKVWPYVGVKTWAAFYAKLAAKAQATPKGEPIVAEGYADEILGGHPLAADLDRVVPDHPLIVTHSSGHRLVANTMALRLAGITKDTPDPVGGRFERSADGEPNGIVLETAMEPLKSAIEARTPKPGAAELTEAYREEFRLFASWGLTGIADAWTDLDKLAVYRKLLTSGMPISIYAMLQTDKLDWLIAHRGDAEWRVPGLTMRTLKVVAGNSFSGRTALLYEPYANRPDYYGLEPAMGPAQLNAIVARAQASGVQLAVHANGDREIDRVLDAFEAAQKAYPAADSRNRVEHASVMTAKILARAKALGACFAPHSYILNNGEKFEDYGESRFEWIEPNRRALDAGVCIGGNSDYPISPARVTERLQSLVTRRAASNGKVYGASQRLTSEEAVRTFTIGSAFLQFEEHERGSIAPGKRADFVVLSVDPTKTDPEVIAAIDVLATYVAGKAVFDASKQGAARFSF